MNFYAAGGIFILPFFITFMDEAFGVFPVLLYLFLPVHILLNLYLKNLIDI